MKMRRDMVTGIVGLLTCVFFCFMREYPKVCVNLQTDVI